MITKMLGDTYAVVDQIFQVFEDVRSVFRSWDASKHMPFIQQVMRLQELESRLYQLGYDEEFVRLLVRAVYTSVFTDIERRQYAGNWHILA